VDPRLVALAHGLQPHRAVEVHRGLSEHAARDAGSDLRLKP
jgi:hypothetical protein